MYSFFMNSPYPAGMASGGRVEARGRIKTAARLPALHYTDWPCAPATYELIFNQIITRVKGRAYLGGAFPLWGFRPLKKSQHEAAKRFIIAL
jgi:hypothetical protein